MTDMSAVADAIYPDLATNKVAGDELLRRDLSAQIPANVAELRKETPHRAMYSTETEKRLSQVSPDFAGQVGQEAARIFSDCGLSADRVETVMNIAKNYQGRAVDAVTRAEWDQAVNAVERADAKALMARDPRMTKLLERYGAAGHPRVVQLFAAAAAEERRQGRLK